MTTRVGIEALTVAVPRRYIELSDLARARGIEPDKYTVGLGCQRMAVADPGEDAVALAATAARRLLDATGLDPDRIGMLVVGNESGVDHAKPVASHVQGLLGLPGGMRVYDVTHACYGGTAALMAAAGWIASGMADGRVALVICADVARYGLRTAGEPTQGAGAVALLVSDQPHILQLDLGASGVYSSDVYDFWRPVGRREAVVDGHYSIQCYLDALGQAYRAWRGKAIERSLIAPGAAQLPGEALDRILYHVPFPKMARKAHSHLRRCDLEDLGQLPLDLDTEAAEAKHGLASFEQQVAASLRLCAEVGNIYTGALYLGLAGLLDREAAALAGRRLGLFSYGSGCSSEFFSGTVGVGAAQAIQAAALTDVMAERRRIDIPEYEHIMGLAADEPLAEEPAAGAFRLVEIRDHKRIYTPAALAPQVRGAAQPGQQQHRLS